MFIITGAGVGGVGVNEALQQERYDWFLNVMGCDEASAMAKTLGCVTLDNALRVRSPGVDVKTAEDMRKMVQVRYIVTTSSWWWWWRWWLSCGCSMNT